MKDVFWLVEGKLAGRSGPNKTPWDLQELAANGIKVIVSLNDANQCDESAMAEVGILHRVFTLPDSIPPTLDDLAICTEILPKILAFIAQCEADNLPVLIHCRSGKDRTGLMMAYYLMKNGAAPLHAVSQVRNVREIAFSADGWDQFVFDVLYALQD
ncbi:dual specificity protein phosphatase [Shewanella denitrificans OS217]|uniref:Dual specificity protein phosphatase n=1 Tax=Shewanella denitrificans (strain OS217 / ATCC BAA-1090 / DSM 15013) TaxID=318161 RepID=Q12L68_SHEDO|nr:dual specificity protein phosphatase family protein [Shewanella denitrificans]ABE55808.1 dual specificity protein phosphatase [Shewanella denitrificans OS217]